MKEESQQYMSGNNRPFTASFYKALDIITTMRNQNDQSIPYWIQHFKAIAYADDLMVGIGSSSNWRTLLSLLQKYESATNSNVNKEKSILVPITEVAQTINLPNQNLFKVANEETLLRILGYEVNIKGAAKKHLWEDLIQNLVPSLPSSTKKKQLNKINDLISRWIKDKSKLLPRYSTFQLDYNRGGLDAPAKIERALIYQNLRNKRNISVVTALTRFPIKLKEWPDNWKPYLVAWKRLKGNITATKIHKQPGNNFTVKKATEYLKQYSVQPTATQAPTNIQEDLSKHFQWVTTKSVRQFGIRDTVSLRTRKVFTASNI
ncbi:857_t:CDS:2 [Ambispora leptoticha]|uniref:857_t:CDS:1 n=1 Tax=Ambispora leptoticha TaxID=144679 RepID=A0A9N9C9K1_9GLOM|nr:857_t:CDS:2 [Ambispora leptoticha]